jgi:hypothetical protein
MDMNWLEKQPFFEVIYEKTSMDNWEKKFKRDYEDDNFWYEMLRSRRCYDSLMYNEKIYDKKYFYKINGFYWQTVLRKYAWRKYTTSPKKIIFGNFEPKLAQSAFDTFRNWTENAEKVYKGKNFRICLGSRNRLDKSTRPSRSIPKITKIDTRWIGCGSLLGWSDLYDRRGLNS